MKTHSLLNFTDILLLLLLLFIMCILSCIQTPDIEVFDREKSSPFT